LRKQYLISGCSDEAVKEQYEINVFGILRLIRAALPYLREQRSGLILNFSSIGGFHGFPANGIYCSTKFALEGITEALAQEVAPFGIEAAIVEPGYFRTNFLASASAGQNLAPAMPEYDNTPVGEARQAFSKYNLKQPGNPVILAERVWEYAAKKGLFADRKRRLRLPLGSDTGAQLRAFIVDLQETADEYREVYESTDFKD
jgi:NAD(P)-dependent dehydrogenase (short-subunit alcohol dehydrogenase family)